MPRPYLLIALAAIMLAAKAPAQTAGDPVVEVVPRAEITLQPLNPLRGDLSPKAGVLWGDIKQDVPTGTLIEFVDGFASPPHIHNITYRGVVISGEVHNDDPEAARLWMGPGSFWTQPAGETHITAAKSGSTATAFLEILEGPYLVRPAEEEFDNGERPVNIEARNVIWLEAADIAWISAAPGSGVEISFLWGSPRPEALNGTFLRLPPGAEGHLQGGQAWLRAVLISGQARHAVEGLTNPVDLDTGSYFGSTGAAMHNLACRSAIACLLYIRTEGRYRFTAF
ncbi:MAG: DUF4437 domain-containing protein [Pseudomonadota bacterium]